MGASVGLGSAHLGSFKSRGSDASGSRHSDSAGSDVCLKSQNSQMSLMSDLPPLLTDRHSFSNEKPVFVQALIALASMLCDLVIELDEDFQVIPERGELDSFFRSEVENRPFVDIVAMADRYQVETALQETSLHQPQLMRAVLLSEDGIGTIEAKLMIMAGSGMLNARNRLIGVRIENTQGLTLPHTLFDSEETDGCGQIGPSASVVPGIVTMEPPPSLHLPRPVSRMSKNSNPRYSHASEASFALSRDGTYKSGMSLAYSASIASSAVSFASRLKDVPLRAPNRFKSSTSRMSSASQNSHMSRLSRLNSRAKDVQTSETQTETEPQTTVSTQTDTSHIPSARSSLRPPRDPSGSQGLSSLYSGRSPRASGHGHRISKQRNSSTSGGATSGDSRRSSRSNSDSSRFSRLSGTSTGSTDLVIRHFQATPIQTIAFYLDTLTEHVNSHIGFSCCSWHATVRSINCGVNLLTDSNCKKQSWLPSSGWQCADCLALNDVDEDECTICYGDRTPDTAADSDDIYNQRPSASVPMQDCWNQRPSAVPVQERGSTSSMLQNSKSLHGLGELKVQVVPLPTLPSIGGTDKVSKHAESSTTSSSSGQSSGNQPRRRTELISADATGNQKNGNRISLGTKPALRQPFIT